MKREICFDLQLEPGMAALLAMHSFYNMTNVVLRELTQLKTVFGESEELKSSTEFFSSLLEDFSNPELAMPAVRRCCEQKSRMLGALSRYLRKIEDDPSSGPVSMLERGLDNIRDILDFFALRSREIHARLIAPVPWHPYDIEYVERSLHEFFDLMVQVCNERFAVVYSANNQGAKDYLVDIDIHGEDGTSILLPRAIHDCLRDLLANARKYTAPGGKIKLSMVERDSVLDIRVSDTGRGIPENEIDEVLLFGKRGSNTAKEETCGGGWGLTRVYDTCCRFGGRIWISSAIGQGTVIEIIIPVPVAGKM